MFRDHHSSGVVSGWMIGSAAIVAAVICLPFSTGTSAAIMNVAQTHASVALKANTSNAALKGDRLDRIAAEAGGAKSMLARSPLKAADHSGADAVRERTEPAPTSHRKIPVGCESAFSKLVAAQNFTGRCVTNIDPAAKYAQLHTSDQT